MTNTNNKKTKPSKYLKKVFKLVFIATSILLFSSNSSAAEQSLLNASYDIGRELYQDLNKHFVPYWEQKTGKSINIKQSHAGTSKQVRSIQKGLEADVVTFNQTIDIDSLAKSGHVDNDWTNAFPNSASPYYSLPSFLVRKGNPKNIKDWDDLIKPGVEIIFPNPKTSGNGRYTFLAAYSFALIKYNNDKEKAFEFVKKLLKNVKIFDTGGRGSTISFTTRRLGDVLITFEAETLSILERNKQEGHDDYISVVPSISLLAEFPVAVVKSYAQKHKTENLAKAYLDFIYDEEGQTIAAKYNNRVHHDKVIAANKDKFPAVKLLNVEETLGSWKDIQEIYFNRDGIFEQASKK